jgi:energy-coupling factor transporter ATP-binding protein EcfA2
LKHKTIIFVTHHLQYLPACDSVVHVSDGSIVGPQNYSDLIAANQSFAEAVASTKEEGAALGLCEGDTNGNGEGSFCCPGLSNGDGGYADSGRGGETYADGFVDTACTDCTSLSTHDAFVGTLKRVPKEAVCRSEIGRTVGSNEDSIGGDTNKVPQPQFVDCDNTTRYSGKSASKSDGKLVKAETIPVASVSRATFAGFAEAGGGVSLAVFVVLFFAVAMGGKIFSDFWPVTISPLRLVLAVTSC